MAQPVADYDDMANNINVPYTLAQLRTLTVRQLKGICRHWNIQYLGIQPFLFQNGNQTTRKLPYANAILAHANNVVNDPANPPIEPPANPLANPPLIPNPQGNPPIIPQHNPPAIDPNQLVNGMIAYKGMDKFNYKFDGSQDVVGFINDIEIYKQIFNKPDDVMYAVIISQALKGKVKEKWILWRHIALDYKTTLDWLYKEYSGSKRLKMVYDKWSNWKETKKLSPKALWSNYLSALQKIRNEIRFAAARGIVSDIDYEPTQREICANFINNIPQYARIQLMTRIVESGEPRTEHLITKCIKQMEEIYNPTGGIEIYDYDNNLDPTSKNQKRYTPHYKSKKQYNKDRKNSNYKGKHYDPNYNPKKKRSNYKRNNYDSNYNKRNTNNHRGGYKGNNLDPNYNKNRNRNNKYNKNTNNNNNTKSKYVPKHIKCYNCGENHYKTDCPKAEHKRIKIIEHDGQRVEEYKNVKNEYKMIKVMDISTEELITDYAESLHKEPTSRPMEFVVDHPSVSDDTFQYKADQNTPSVPCITLKHPLYDIHSDKVAIYKLNTRTLHIVPCNTLSSGIPNVEDIIASYNSSESERTNNKSVITPNNSITGSVESKYSNTDYEKDKNRSYEIYETNNIENNLSETNEIDTIQSNTDKITIHPLKYYEELDPMIDIKWDQIPWDKLSTQEQFDNKEAHIPWNLYMDDDDEINDVEPTETHKLISYRLLDTLETANIMDLDHNTMKLQILTKEIGEQTVLLDTGSSINVIYYPLAQKYEHLMIKSKKFVVRTGSGNIALNHYIQLRIAAINNPNDWYHAKFFVIPEIDSNSPMILSRKLMYQLE